MLVLETDDPHPEAEEQKGSYGEILDTLFKKAAGNHNPRLEIETDTHFVVDDPENDKHGHVPKASEIPESVKAILITGSMYDAHGTDPWILRLMELLTDLWQTRPEMKFSGICFGHQVLARTLGSKVEQEEKGNWELSHTVMDLTAVGKKLFRTKNDTLDLHQMHQDQVTTVPSSETTDLLTKDQNVHIWASTEHTKIQGLYIKDRLFTSQGHLGFDKKMVEHEVNMRVESGSIEDKKLAKEAKKDAHKEHDGVQVAEAILRFFHGEDHDID